MAEKNLTKENRKLHEKLDPRYKKVYEDILIYIRVNTSSESHETEAALNTLLKKIIQTQREGGSITSVTGEDYRAYADSLIEKLPQRNILRLASFLALILVGLNLIFDYLIQIFFRLIDSAALSTTLVVIQFTLEMIITAALVIGFIYAIFHTFRQIAFKAWPAWKGVWAVLSDRIRLLPPLYVPQYPPHFYRFGAIIRSEYVFDSIAWYYPTSPWYTRVL